MTVEEILKGDNYHLIDVREDLELEMDGKIEKADHIPLGELEDRKQEVTNLTGPKVFFCRSGGRSQKAMEYFKSEGLTDVYNGGGYEDVKAALENK